MRSARHSEPELGEDEVLALISGNTGVSVRQIETAIRYWSRYREEIDAEVAANEAAEEQAEAAWRRGHELLSRR